MMPLGVVCSDGNLATDVLVWCPEEYGEKYAVHRTYTTQSIHTVLVAILNFRPNGVAKAVRKQEVALARQNRLMADGNLLKLQSMVVVTQIINHTCIGGFKPIKPWVYDI
jgi:hypothetical protein